MSELDKFKRRLVRSVARLLKQNPETHDDVWERMRKETSCDCKLLWERMRALTIKKLKRLITAEDRVENIASVARLSVTDWLLFDLVLAHEKVDVIGRDQLGKGKSSIMEELLDMVVYFDIEKKSGEQLLEAWTALTQQYNSNGRKCSPMLLQKRWYQLKESTRCSFYKLWSNYRGNQKLWDIAKNSAPTPLEADIAKKFPQVITQPFPEWEDLIQLDRVILSEKFEMQYRMKNRPKTGDDKPDIVVIEPVIETIDLGEENDDDENPTNNDDSQPESADNTVNLALVKQEPDDGITIKEEPVDGLSNVQILEASHVELNEDNDSNSNLSSISVNEANRENFALQNVMKASTTTDSASKSTAEIETKTQDAGIQDIETQDTEIADDLIKRKAEEFIKSKSKPLEQELTPTVIEDKNDDDIVDDIIKQKADDFVRKVDMKKLVNDVVQEFKLPAELTFADDGIEFVDDGIECDEEDYEAAEKKNNEIVMKTDVDEDEEDVKKKEENSDEDIKEAGSPNFDLKLLMEPVVYTTKLDDMIVFKGKIFNFVQFQNVIDSVIVESKPVSSRAMKVEVKEENDDDDDDGESLSNDITAGIDQLFKNNVSQSHSNKTEDATNTALNDYLCKNNSDAPSNDVFVNDSSCHSSNDDYESDRHINDSFAIEATSDLLHKPRHRNYNSINLCKNPDFNTRLKRLTVGFFSSERNRKLFSACKPMTIDLHKAFEAKLVDGKLYIKSSGGSPQKAVDNIDNAQSASVMPSAMPVQSLLSKEQTNVTIDDLMSSTQIDTVDLTQRSKTINLRDLSEIRRINQNLLTAQVPPMRIESSGYVNNDPTYRSEDLNEHLDVANKPVEDSDEPKVVGIAGGQQLSLNCLPPEVNEDEPFMDKTFKTYRGPSRGRGRGRFMRSTLITPVPTRVSYAPWTLRKPPTRPPNLDDFLITIDTLNRMINKLDGISDFSVPYKKHKKHIWSVDKTQHDLIANDNSNQVTKPNNAPVIIETDNSAFVSEENHVTVNESEPVKVSNQTSEVGKNPTKNVSKTFQTRKPKSTSLYCCWAGEKVAKFGTNQRINRRHRCRINCECCCKDIMHKLIKECSLFNSHKQTEPEKDGGCIVLSDEDTDANLATDDSNDVRIPGFDPEEDMPPAPKVRVVNYRVSKGTNSCSHSKSTCTSLCAGRGTPMSVSAVSATQASVSAVSNTPACVSVVSATQTTTTYSEPQPVLRINVNFTPTPPSEVSPAIPVIPSINTGAAIPQTSLLEHIAAHISPISATADPTMLQKNPPPLIQKVPLPQQTINTLQRQIIIDASEPSIGIGTDYKAPSTGDDRVLFLNSKCISQKPKESPIFLGKNKILLTTVKFPAHITGNMSPLNPASPLQPAKVKPSLTLPPGVQLVLMPDGQLTYTLDPSLELNEEQLSILPKILAAVQQQIDMSQQIETASSLDNSKIAPSEVCTVASNSVYDSNTTGELVNDKQPGDETVTSALASDQTLNDSSENVIEENQNITQPDIIHDIVGNIGIQENDNIIDHPEQNSISIETQPNTTETKNVDINNSKNSDIVTIEETDDAPDAKVSNTDTNNKTNDGASNSRNLLSDLMEMSGISQEDTKVQESVTQVSIPAADSLIPLLTAMPVVDNPAIPIITVNPDGSAENPSENVLSVSESVKSGIPNLTKLSPITSLVELKYAFENNGLFYKLDLDTGILAPINVCIKKNAKRKILNRYLNVPTRDPKSVIDLTDEVDIESPKNILKDGTVKPIKLLKRVIYQPTSLLRKKPNLLTRKPVERSDDSSNVENIQPTLQHKQYKRKQNLAKIEARIDLIDSDDPMEEEYLVDSSSSEDDGPRNLNDLINRKIPAPSVDDSDDSSDEEPLAKKFMRLKEVNRTSSIQRTDNPVRDGLEENNGETETEEIPNVPDNVTLPISPLEPTGSTEIDADKVANTDNLNSDDMDIEDSQFESFLAEETEPQEEDCILGF